ncbi:MAG: transcription antitermination factor NusB [Firmicutes bacterium]|nr:transcription antitermination factor NusB [Bacillota bacterium]
MSRRAAREQALKGIYQLDVGKAKPMEAYESVVAEIPLTSAGKEFLRELVWGMWENRAHIDGLIEQFAIDWALERFSRVDRAILRLAVYEMIFREDIPVSVSINEAVELCKKYSGADSGRFVNGILGGISGTLNRAGRGDE